jgi:hypothetical protein
MTFTFDKVEYTGTAVISPEYQKTDIYGDVAIITVNEDIKKAKPYSLSLSGVKVGDKVTVFGYGCTTKDMLSATFDGKLRSGDSEVTAINTFDIELSAKGTHAILCSGDSGGPDFIVSGKKLTQIAVNSRVTLNPSNTTQITGPSTVAGFDYKDIQDFIIGVAKTVSICGVNLTCP